MVLSIVIPTFNKIESLKKTITKLLSQEINDLEIIIVDNLSTDGTFQYLSDLSNYYHQIRVIKETKIGTSHARNRGISESKAEWIIFLDDDIIVEKDFLYQILLIINESNLDCFGGCIEPLFIGNPPRWFKGEYESNCKRYNLVRGENIEYIWGGCLAVNRKVAIDIGGFNTQLGPKGNSYGYGEDTDFVRKLISANYRLSLEEKIKAFHIIHGTEISIKSVLEKYFRKGESYLHFKEKPNSIALIFKLIPRIFKRLVINPWFLLKKKDYFIENYLIDVLELIVFQIGLVKGFLLSHNN